MKVVEPDELSVCGAFEFLTFLLRVAFYITDSLETDDGNRRLCGRGSGYPTSTKASVVSFLAAQD